MSNFCPSNSIHSLLKLQFISTFQSNFKSLSSCPSHSQVLCLSATYPSIIGLITYVIIISIWLRITFFASISLPLCNTFRYLSSFIYLNSFNWLISLAMNSALSFVNSLNVVTAFMLLAHSYFLLPSYIKFQSLSI
jgi:hypothetical protein